MKKAYGLLFFGLSLVGISSSARASLPGVETAASSTQEIESVVSDVAAALEGMGPLATACSNCRHYCRMCKHRCNRTCRKCTVGGPFRA